MGTYTWRYMDTVESVDMSHVNMNMYHEPDPARANRMTAKVDEEVKRDYSIQCYNNQLTFGESVESWAMTDSAQYQSSSTRSTLCTIFADSTNLYIDALAFRNAVTLRFQRRTRRP